MCMLVGGWMMGKVKLLSPEGDPINLDYDWEGQEDHVIEVKAPERLDSEWPLRCNGFIKWLFKNKTKQTH